MPISQHTRIMKTFGSRLKAAREAAQFRSAESFANEMGIEPHTYRKYERGSTQPPFETLTRICRRLHVTPNDLLPEAATKKNPGLPRFDGTPHTSPLK
jgi:transcriptional regulator with XRE-family HTH domain